jgi:hypothetical protein
VPLCLSVRASLSMHMQRFPARPRTITGSSSGRLANTGSIVSSTCSQDVPELLCTLVSQPRSHAPT